MSFVPILIDALAVFFFTVCLHYYFGNWRKHHIIVTLATGMSWFLPFLIISLLPVDISITCYEQCINPTTSATTLNVGTSTAVVTGTITDSSVVSTSSLVMLDTSLSVLTNEYDNTTNSNIPKCKEPVSFISRQALNIFWHVVYWTSQSLTWVILPIMQSYSKAGEFTVLGKMKYTLIANGIYYGTYLLIFSICLIYLVSQGLEFSPGQIKVLAITASNTWGLFLLVLLLGYGLVEIPRLCWNYSKRQYSLKRIRFKVAKMSIERIEAEEAQEDTLAEVKRISETIRPSHPYRRLIDTIIRKCPESFRSSLVSTNTQSRRGHDDFMGIVESEGSDRDINEAFLVKLHRRVIVSVQNYNANMCQWNKLVEQAIYLEDVCRNQASGSRVFVATAGASSGILWSNYRFPKIEWYWKCLFVPWSLRLVAAFLALMSLMVVWSECLFFIIEPVLSLFARFLDIAKLHYNYVAIEFVCVFAIAYISVCAYYTVFKLRIFNYYVVIGNHHTDEYSMIFCGMMLCRLTPPLCLNFLGMLHLDSHITRGTMQETAYTAFMGHMDVISFISNGFNIYFPIAIVLLCFLTGFNVGQRLLHCLGFQQFIGDDDMTQELIDEGEQLITREVRKRQRNEEMESRRTTRQSERADRSRSRATGSSTLPDTEETSRKRVLGRITNENDRSELLDEAEPMDYRSGPGSEFSTSVPAVRPHDFMSGLYQASGAGPRPIEPTGMDWSVAAGTNRSNRYNPPRGIFDDV